MRTAIALAAATPLLLNATCWLSCECAPVCPAWDAAVCVGISIATGAVIYIAASMAWELHGLTRYRPPVFGTRSVD